MFLSVACQFSYLVVVRWGPSGPTFTPTAAMIHMNVAEIPTSDHFDCGKPEETHEIISFLFIGHGWMQRSALNSFRGWSPRLQLIKSSKRVFALPFPSLSVGGGHFTWPSLQVLSSLEGQDSAAGFSQNHAGRRCENDDPKQSETTTSSER